MITTPELKCLISPYDIKFVTIRSRKGCALRVPSLLTTKFGPSPCFQDGWTDLDAWGPSRTSRTINRRPGRLIDPGRVPWSSWSSPIWGTYIYHIYNIYIYYSYNNTYITPYIYTHTHTHTYILHLLGYR